LGVRWHQQLRRTPTDLGAHCEFETDWKNGQTPGALACDARFPTETLHTLADVARLAIENNMSARARLVEIAYRDQDKAYDVFVGTTAPNDRHCAAQLELANATVLGLLPAQIAIAVKTVEEAEVDLNLGFMSGYSHIKSARPWPFNDTCQRQGVQ
jgi:hypothetical protein